MLWASSLSADMVGNVTRRILLVKLGSKGDILQASPVSRALAKSDIQVDWLVFDEHRHLIERNPFVSIAITTPKKSILALLRFFKLIRHSQYDAVFIFHRHWLFSLFFWLVRIPVRIGWTSHTNPLLTHPIPFQLSLSVYRLHMAALHHIGLSIPYSTDTWQSVYKLPENVILPDALSHSPLIVIAPGGGRNRFANMPTKLWPYYDELIMALRPRFPTHTIAIVGDAFDSLFIKNYRSLTLPNVHSIAGIGSIDQMAKLISIADYFIGNDSFALHLSAAFTTRIIGLFGPTDAKWLTPLLPYATHAYQHVACSPCYDPINHKSSLAYHCPYQNQCMTHLSLEKVLKLFDNESH